MNCSKKTPEGQTALKKPSCRYQGKVTTRPPSAFLRGRLLLAEDTAFLHWLAFPGHLIARSWKRWHRQRSSSSFNCSSPRIIIKYSIFSSLIFKPGHPRPFMFQEDQRREIPTPKGPQRSEGNLPLREIFSGAVKPEFKGQNDRG